MNSIKKQIAGAPVGVSEAAEWAARRLCAGKACTAIVLGGCSAAAGCTPSRCAWLAASEQCPRGAGPGWAGAAGRALRAGLGGLRRGGGGGWAGIARSAALEAAQRRRLHHPGLRAGQRRGGGTRVCAEGLLDPAAPGQAPRAGPGGRGRCAGGGGARGRPGVETSPGRVAPDGSEGGPAGAPRAAALPAAFALQSPSPGDLRLNAVSP